MRARLRSASASPSAEPTGAPPSVRPESLLEPVRTGAVPAQRPVATASAAVAPIVTPAPGGIRSASSSMRAVALTFCAVEIPSSGSIEVIALALRAASSSDGIPSAGVGCRRRPRRTRTTRGPGSCRRPC